MSKLPTDPNTSSETSAEINDGGKNCNTILNGGIPLYLSHGFKSCSTGERGSCTLAVNFMERDKYQCKTACGIRFYKILGKKLPIIMQQLFNG